MFWFGGFCGSEKWVTCPSYYSRAYTMQVFVSIPCLNSAVKTSIYSLNIAIGRPCLNCYLNAVDAFVCG